VLNQLRLIKNFDSCIERQAQAQLLPLPAGFALWPVVE